MTTNTLPTSRALSVEDKKRALLIISELRARGKTLPTDLEIPQSGISVDWGTDDRGYFVKKDGTNFNPRKELSDFIEDESRFILLKSGRGGGKALSLETEIPTLNGWKTMGSIQVGDLVFDESGCPVEVLFTSDIMYGNRCYEVEFIDGTKVVADAEHLWTILTENGRSQKNRGGKSNYYKTLTTEDMVEDYQLFKYGNLYYNYTVDLSKPVQYNPSESLPIHPYVLGAWLGDGSSRSSSITISPNDHEMIDIIESFGYPLHNISDEFTWSFSSRKSISPLTSGVRELGVWQNKHIPPKYLQGSMTQRLFLLQGLMDTDGTISKRGHASFDNKNYALAIQTLELVKSLGMKATIHRYEILDFDTPTWSYKVAFTPTIPVFRLSRKLLRQSQKNYDDKRNGRLAIVGITPCESVPVRCIEVDSPSHLYLVTRSYIPTHNTASGCQKTLRKIQQGESGAVMNPDFENFCKSTWPELREWIPWNMVVPKHRYRSSPSWEPIRPFTIVFVNGARMYCKGLKDPESARGANLNWFWYDEGRRDPTGLGWKNAIAFLRVGKKPQAWCTTTMASIDHWTNTFFQGKMSEELKKIIMEAQAVSGTEQNMFSIHKTSPKENIENLDPMFYASLVSTYSTGYLRAREVDGEASDEGGSLGTREWFDGKDLKEIPDWVAKFTRFWDLAATEQKILKGKKLNDPDETVGTLLGTDNVKDLNTKRYVVCDQAGGYLAWKQLKEFVLDQTRRDIQALGYVTVCFEQEPASGGKNQIAELMEYLEEQLKKKYSIHPNQYKLDSLKARDLGDRVLAANTWFSEANNGQFFYVNGLWTGKFFEQLDTFDGVRHDDRITSLTGARHHIAPIQKKFGKIEFLAL